MRWQTAKTVKSQNALELQEQKNAVTSAQATAQLVKDQSIANLKAAEASHAQALKLAAEKANAEQKAALNEKSDSMHKERVTVLEKEVCGARPW
jgi:hypothetical protein